jgi:hypothetical protein
MLAGNEEPHLALAGMEEMERARMEDRRLSRFPGGSSTPAGSAGGGRREMATGLSTAPFGRPTQTPMGQSQTKSSASKLELTGRLTLSGVGGQPLGMAEIDAESK